MAPQPPGQEALRTTRKQHSLALLVSYFYNRLANGSSAPVDDIIEDQYSRIIPHELLADNYQLAAVGINRTPGFVCHLAMR